MIAETLAGIALFKSAVDGIRSAIGTANDVGDIANYIDDLFLGEKQVQKARNKKAGSGSLGDQFGVDTVAREVIDAKIAKEKMYEISQMVDLRFGHGTWAGIVTERAKRIQEAKEAAKVAQRAALKKHNEMMENVKIGLMIFFVGLVGLGAFILVMISAAKALSV